MPFDRSKYPGWWPQFSKFIRFERAKNVCEDCGAKNHEIGKKGRDGVWRTESEIHGLNSDVGFDLYGDWNFKCSKVNLTVAHLDDENGVCKCFQTTGMKCTNPNHVKALCQSCHLSLDKDSHLANRRKTIAKQKDAERRLFE